MVGSRFASSTQVVMAAAITAIVATVAHTRTYPSHIPAHTPVHRFWSPVSAGGGIAHTLRLSCTYPRQAAHTSPHIPAHTYRFAAHTLSCFSAISITCRRWSLQHVFCTSSIVDHEGVAGGGYVHGMCEGMCGYVRVRFQGGPFLGRHLDLCFGGSFFSQFWFSGVFPQPRMVYFA